MENFKTEAAKPVHVVVFAMQGDKVVRAEASSSSLKSKAIDPDFQEEIRRKIAAEKKAEQQETQEDQRPRGKNKQKPTPKRWRKR